MTGQTGATPVPAQSLYPSSHPTVLSGFRCLVHNHPHTPCHAESVGFSFHAVAEPVRLSLSMLPGPQWLAVLPSTWASVSVEVLPWQYSFATGHLRLGVWCTVPATSCLSTARNRMQTPVNTLLEVLLLPVRPMYLRPRLLVQVVLLCVFLFALGTLLCFPVFFCLVLPVDASTGTGSSPPVAKCAPSACPLAFYLLVLWLNLSHCANVNTSCAARSFRFSPFHRSSAVWYAGSAAHASLSAAAPLLTSAMIQCVTDFLARSGILRLSVLN